MRRRITLSLGLLAFVAAAATPARALDIAFGEFRGMWISRFEYNEDSPSNIRAIINNAADMGITDVIWQVRGRGDAFYNSNFEPRAQELTTQTDPLQVALDAAHGRGVKLHAWLNTMPLWRDSPQPNDSSHAFYNTNPSFRVTDASGAVERLNFNGAGYGSSFTDNLGYARINHVLPEAQQHINNVVNDIATNYAVDGIHLDYIRWLGPDGGPSENYRPDWDFLPHDPYSHELYFEETGRDAADGSTFARRDQYRDWVQGKITELVTSVGQTVDAAEVSENREIALSAAVWNNPTTAENVYLQDYRSWLEQDLLDIAMPMVYLSNSNSHRMAGFLFDIFRTRTNTDISIGLGSYLHTASGGGVDETIRQLQQVFESPADSATFFSYGSMFGGSLDNARRQAVVDWYEANTELRGDFNGDGVVDAADYSIWRDTRSTFGANLPADGNGNGFVDDLDYAIWTSNFSADAADAPVSTTPEPASAVLVLLAAIGAASLRIST